jgi:signal transduction histidine kinase/CheY-like chemotaxis protein
MGPRDLKRFDALFLDHPQPAWLVDRASMRLLTANHAAATVTGFSRDELQGMPYEALLSKDESPRIRALKSAPPSDSWITCVRDQRCPGEHHARVTELYRKWDAAGTVELAMLMEMAAPECAEAEPWQALAKNALSGIGRYSLAQRRILMHNEILAAMIGLPAPCGGNSDRDYLEHAFATVREWAEFLDAVHSRTEFVKDVEWRNNDGGIVNVRLQARVVDSPRGLLVDLSALDVTKFVQLELELQQAHKMDALGRMAGGIAHDFNNLLTIIRGHAELLESALTAKSPLHHHAVKLIAAARQAADITGTLLTFSRREEHPSEPIALNKCLRNQAMILPSLLGSNINLDFELGAGEYFVAVGPGQIEQVVMNLCVNARDAMAGGGQLTLRTELIPAGGKLRGESILLQVSDTGAGMSPETRARIFEPFYTTKSRGKGTGLGLALVYGVLVQCQGEIEVESEIGQGTSFKLYFPLVRHEKAQNQFVCEQPSGRTVLLVDDEPEIRTMVEDFLCRMGYTVISASCADEALESAKKAQNKIDLLFTDVVMPRMDGFELALKLRERNPDLPVLIMSGFTGGALSKAAQSLRDVPFLTKPFSLRQLQASLKSIFAAPAKPVAEDGAALRVAHSACQI